MINDGIPARRGRSAAALAVRGVNSDGLTATVQPRANVGPTCQKTMYAKNYCLSYHFVLKILVNGEVYCMARDLSGYHC